MFKEKVAAAYSALRAEGLRASAALARARTTARYKSGIKTYMMQGEETLLNGWSIKVEVAPDDLNEAPWENNCCHGVITPWQRGSSHLDGWEVASVRGMYRYYDWKESVAIALRDRWDSAPYGQGTAYERALRAVTADYERLRQWADGQWEYVVLNVALLDEQGDVIDEESCGGIESDSHTYLCESARSWAAWMIKNARNKQREASRQARIASRFKDAMECGV